MIEKNGVSDGYEMKIAGILYVKFMGNVIDCHFQANWTPFFISISSGDFNVCAIGVSHRRAPSLPGPCEQDSNFSELRAPRALKIAAVRYYTDVLVW